MHPDPPADAVPAPSGVGYAYPTDLAALVQTRWADAATAGKISLPTPSLSDLNRLLQVCYQATLLREEGRPVTFRLAVAAPATFDPTAGPPSGLHRLVFGRPLPLDQHEIRRLAPAAAFARSLIAATVAGAQQDIWGVIHSGPQWLQVVRGGRETSQAIPQMLIVAATGPGRLLVNVGTRTLAELRNGTLFNPDIDVFASRWMHERLSALSGVQRVAHERARAGAAVPWAHVDPSFIAVLAGHVLRRVLATIRAAQHGGTLIILPARLVENGLVDGSGLRLKYVFRDDEARRRILTLMVDIINELARNEGPVRAEVGWTTYEASRAHGLGRMDDALFEVAHLIADLAHVDGTVVMTDGLEILGFGAEIAGELPEVLQVARALDPEAAAREWVRTDRVGTRHRSAYRLCQAVHDALACVVSQDGGLRFIRWHDDGVTSWEQVATGLWDA